MISRALYQHVALPLVDFARRTDSLKAFRALDRSQWSSRARLEEMQVERLRALLIHAGMRVPYYRELFSDCGFIPSRLKSVEDLRPIPLLTKEIIRRDGARLMADNAAEFQPRPHRSAGTTGNPIVIQMDRMRHSIGWADMYRWWTAGGWRLGEKQFVVAGAALQPRRLSGYKARLYSRLNRFEDYTAFDLSDAVLDRLLLRLERYPGPVFLRGYASSIFALAQHAARRNWNRRVQAVFTTAEVLFPEQRRVIEASFRGSLFDQWGCRDGGISAFECDQHHGLHLAIENAVVEICRDGTPLPVGEAGDVIATDLFSYAMPIIRYRVGDVASYSKATCTCGRGLPLIASVLGRVSGFLVGSGGRRIHGEFFSHVFWETPWVKEFQIVQDVPEEIVVRIVSAGEPPAQSLSHVHQLMQTQAGQDCRVRIEFVPEIPVGAMGKRQFVICRIPQ